MGTAKNSMVYIGDNMAKIAPTMAKGMTLTFDYVDGEWIFSVSGITSYINNVVNNNRRHVELQIIRFVTGTTSVKRVNPAKGTYNSKEKKSFTFNGVSGTLYGKTEITEQFKDSPQHINMTDWVNKILYEDTIKIGNKPVVGKFYDDNGYWYRRYKFCIAVNGIFYSETPILYVYMHHDVYSSPAEFEWEDGAVHMYD